MLIRHLSRAALGLSLVFGAALGLGQSVAHSSSTVSPADYVFPHGLPWAAQEGSCEGVRRCVWDARDQGNGQGRSMILTRWAGGYVAQPITHDRAARLQVAYCERRNVSCAWTD